MFKLFKILARGAAAQAEEELFDRHALLVLDQQIRETRASLERSKLALATAIGQWVNLALLVALAWRKGWTAPNRTLGITILGVAVACLGLAALAFYGLPFVERALPAMPRFRELAVLAVLGLAGTLVYAGLLLGTLRLCGLRLRRT